MHIRRIASPLTPYRENLSDVNYKETQRLKRREHQQNLDEPSSILIGSIKGINQRVCDFESELSTYDSRLTIQSRQAGDARQRNLKSRDGISFEDTYQQNLENDSNSKKGTNEKKTPIKKTLKGPKLMELQQYPGFDSNTPTSLPHVVKMDTINKKVVGALTHLDTKPTYKKLFEQALDTKYHNNLIKDFFWWIFLQKSSPDADVQKKLFERIANNYGWFFMDSSDRRFRDVFFTAYPDVVAQSLYSAFCHCFPQSWKQFDDDEFKMLLSKMTNLWIAGIRPQPCSYLKWNKFLLEPDDMREGQRFNEKSKKTKTGVPGWSRNCDKLSSNAPSTIVASHRSANFKFDTTVSFKPSCKSATVMQPILKRKDSVYLKKKKPVKSSAVSSKEMTFDHNKFNLDGRSPLLNEFLHQTGVKKSGKTDNLISSTQLISIPKSNCFTLNDVITESRKLTRNTRRGFEGILHHGEQAFKEFKIKQQEDKKNLDRRTKKLLEDRERTSMLSNLVMAEVKKDPNAIASEAQRAIWLAVVADTSQENL